MVTKETIPTAIASSLTKTLISPLIYADKSFINLREKYKLFELIRYSIITCFLFLFRLILSLLPSFKPINLDLPYPLAHKPPKIETLLITNGVDEPGIGRALSQLLYLVNEVPVSSRKYELVRCLTEKLIDDNHSENIEVLHEINRVCLSAAFERTLSQLESAMMDTCRDPNGLVREQLDRVLKVVRFVKGRSLSGCDGVDRSEEKLAAELLWLAQKLAACGFVEEATRRWAVASNLGWVALSAEPRLQGSLVKITAFLLKHVKNMGVEVIEEVKKEEKRQEKKNMVMAWLPLLCRGSNGTDAPVLTASEKAELESTLEDIIEKLEHEHDKEKVLSLWLHHFTLSPNSSDWPNLRASYTRWCSASRRLLILH